MFFANRHLDGLEVLGAQSPEVVSGSQDQPAQQSKHVPGIQDLRRLIVFLGGLAGEERLEDPRAFSGNVKEELVQLVRDCVFLALQE